MIQDRKLSNNYQLYEFLKSNEAERSKDLVEKQFSPSQEVVNCIQYQVTHLWQPVREELGVPIHITSGYRCPEVNSLVGSKPTSQHLLGEAGDGHLDVSFLTTSPKKKEIEDSILKITGKSIRKDVNVDFYLFCYLCLNLDRLDIDQVIHEFGRGKGNPAWVHGSSSSRQNRRQILMISNEGTKVLSVKEALSLGV